MVKLLIFIIDDEAPARRELRYLLEQFEEVEIVGEAANGTAAFRGIRETHPDLVFLDIQMPGMNGIELAQFLCELPQRPLLVFATAYSEFALQAFEVEAIDYLCKPFTQERLAKALAKATRLLKAATSLHPPAQPEKSDICRKVPLYRGESIIPTAPERIIYARCEDGETVVHTLDGRFRSRYTLNELEQRLLTSGFARPHRSFLVNTNHIREVVPWFNGGYKLFMDDRENTEIPVSRYNVKALKSILDL